MDLEVEVQDWAALLVWASQKGTQFGGAGVGGAHGTVSSSSLARKQRVLPRPALLSEDAPPPAPMCSCSHRPNSQRSDRTVQSCSPELLAFNTWTFEDTVHS